MGEADVSDETNALTSFAMGLRPILERGDVATFRQYLGRWDDVLGDTSALAVQSDAEVRRTMAEMLRRPVQFGLPAWHERSSALAEVGEAVLAELGAAVDSSIVDVVVLGQVAVKPTDAPESLYDEAADLGRALVSEPSRSAVYESPLTWRQTNFVTGTLVEPRGRIPRVVPAGQSEVARRAAPRIPRGFRQLGLPFGQDD